MIRNLIIRVLTFLAAVVATAAAVSYAYPLPTAAPRDLHFAGDLYLVDNLNSFAADKHFRCGFAQGTFWMQWCFSLASK